METTLDLVLMGERLRACRNTKRMTMKEFAELCGISERYLADIERGHKAPKLETLVRIANAAGISTDYLLLDSLHIGEGQTPNIQDTIKAFTPAQQEIIAHFISQLADSMK